MDILEKFFSLSIIEMIKYIFVAGTFYIFCYFIYKKTLVSAKIQKRDISNKAITQEIYHCLVSSIVLTCIVFFIKINPNSIFSGNIIIKILLIPIN
jgi:hypothetical protein